MKITLGTTYYNNPDNIVQFIDHHIDHVDEMIIVDDGSQEFPLVNYVQPTEKIKIFEVTEDLGFNSHGCRNLIMKQSSNDWVILLDSDRIIKDPAFVIKVIKNKKLNPWVRYMFVIHVLEYGKHVHPSVNDYLIHKDFFFSVGGYDEEIVGVRHGDRLFIDQLTCFGRHWCLDFADVIMTRLSTYPDGHLLVGDQLINFKRQMKIIQNRETHPDPTKPILQFPWRQITNDAVTTNHK